MISTIDKNFLDANAIDDILSKVHMLNDHWREKFSINFLPYGIYSVEPSVYRQSVSSYTDIMCNNFSVYHDKIKLKLEEYFNLDINFDTKCHKVGFHIFGPGPLVYDIENFHCDAFTRFRDYKIHSIIIPLTDVDCGLMYKTDNKIEYFNYEPGTMYCWRGDLVHAIKPFSLDKDEYRITMQMHLAIKHPKHILQKSNTLFW